MKEHFRLHTQQKADVEGVNYPPMHSDRMLGSIAGYTGHIPGKKSGGVVGRK
jgi:hypothetical protein